MPNIMENNAKVAALNPNIQTPLVGAQPSQPLRAPTQAFPSAQQAQSQIQSTVAPIAAAGQAATLPIGQNIEDQMKQLFAFDQQLEQGQSPYAAKPGYVENPADLYRSGAAFAQGTMGNVNAGNNVIQNIIQSYKNIVDSTTEKILQSYRDREEAQRNRRNDLIQILSQTGGDYVDPETNKTYHFPTVQEKNSAIASKNQPLKSILAYIPGASGMEDMAQAPTSTLNTSANLNTRANIKPTPGFVPDPPSNMAVGQY